MDLKGLIGTSFGSSAAALGVATCCILPMTMMLLGLGGSWIAIFGKVAAASYYVLMLSGIFLMVGWVFAVRRGLPAKQKWWLGLSTGFNAIAWVIVFYEGPINDYLITLM